jgi:hypothetical protein
MPITLHYYLARHPSATLLLIQLLGVLLYPWMETTPVGRALFGAFGLVVLGATLRMVRRSPAQTWVAVLLAIMVLTLLTSNVLWPHWQLALAVAVLEGTFYLYAAGSLIAYMTEDRRATADELFASGATFTLLAWAFAFFYLACQVLIPGSFAALVDPQAERTWMELLFLSFVTLSGVGIGDIIPLSPMARALVMLEAFTGVMYIALVVSRLIGLTIMGRR